MYCHANGQYEENFVVFGPICSAKVISQTVTVQSESVDFKTPGWKCTVNPAGS